MFNIRWKFFWLDPQKEEYYHTETDLGSTGLLFPCSSELARLVSSVSALSPIGWSASASTPIGCSPLSNWRTVSSRLKRWSSSTCPAIWRIVAASWYRYSCSLKELCLSPVFWVYMKNLKSHSLQPNFKKLKNFLKIRYFYWRDCRMRIYNIGKYFLVIEPLNLKYAHG